MIRIQNWTIVEIGRTTAMTISSSSQGVQRAIKLNAEVKQTTPPEAIKKVVAYKEK